MLLTFTGFLLAAVVGVFLWWAYRRVLFIASKYYCRYTPVAPGHGSSSSSPRAFSPSRRKLGIFPSFFQLSAFSKQDVESRGSEPHYELLNRDD
jgi:hypothetical protein